MNSRFVIAVLVAVGALAFLIFSAVQESKRPIVTVSSLLKGEQLAKAVRLGARVANVPIEYQTEPKLRVQFSVRDRESTAQVLPIVYYGPMPETLKVDRDVIVEGRFDGSVFTAELLQTQCPSKYEPPPVPGS